MRRLRLQGAGVLAVVVACSGAEALGQGSLTPPPGPPSPTMKTLGQVEPRIPVSALPFRIESSGSYYLTTNLTGTASAHGIVIDASDVTLDLSGFTLAGAPNAQHGIMVASPQRNIVVRSGTIRGWRAAIDARSGAQSQFHDLRLLENGASGLLAGPQTLVDRCAALSNLGPGIMVESGSQVAGSTTSGNTGAGLILSNQCSVTMHIALNNGDTGIAGGADADLSGCKAMGNGNNGISVGGSASIISCSASGNLADGIVAGAGAQVLDSKAAANSRGIVVQAGSSVRGCSALQNSGDGIVVTDRCSVIANHSSDNFLARDAAGVHVTGTDNVIKENILLANDWGLRVDAAGNFILKNSAANNSLAYFIPATPQAMGPIVSGDKFTEATNPIANFDF